MDTFIARLDNNDILVKGPRFQSNNLIISTQRWPRWVGLRKILHAYQLTNSVVLTELIKTSPTPSQQGSNQCLGWDLPRELIIPDTADINTDIGGTHYQGWCNSDSLIWLQAGRGVDRQLMDGQKEGRKEEWRMWGLYELTQLWQSRLWSSYVVTIRSTLQWFNQQFPSLDENCRVLDLYTLERSSSDFLKIFSHLFWHQ